MDDIKRLDELLVELEKIEFQLDSWELNGMFLKNKDEGDCNEQDNKISIVYKR